MSFKILNTDPGCRARTGILKTAHGQIETPIFMPVGTQATIKSVDQSFVENDVAAQIILANTYHLYLRPQTDILHDAGGVHKFMAWEKPILTDSGGYQVYSLSDRRKITEEGVKFSSHIDGSKHLFTPEIVMDIQRLIGADIIMAFDECTPYPCNYKYAKDSLAMTHRWLDRCIHRINETTPHYGYDQVFAPICQGSTYKDLRIESCEYIANTDQKINAIGGLSVGEPHEEMYAMTDVCTSILPESKPRYLMGVGLPENLVECVSLGIDMFDCVLPTRNARHGLLYTWDGVMNIKNEKWKNDHSTIDTRSTSSLSLRYSKAYLRHLFQVKELLANQIASVHNLSFYLDLMKTMREQIKEGTFVSWKNAVLPQLKNRL